MKKFHPANRGEQKEWSCIFRVRPGRRDAGRLRKRSVRITPGTSGLPGKWPTNIESSPANVVAHSAETPGSHATSSRTKTNGGRCGKPRSIIDCGASFVFLTRAIFRRRSAVDKVGELPAPVHTPQSHAVAIVIERFVGELRWRHHEIALLHEFFRQDAV